MESPSGRGQSGSQVLVILGLRADCFLHASQIMYWYSVETNKGSHQREEQGQKLSIGLVTGLSCAYLDDTWVIFQCNHHKGGNTGQRTIRNLGVDGIELANRLWGASITWQHGVTFFELWNSVTSWNSITWRHGGYQGKLTDRWKTPIELPHAQNSQSYPCALQPLLCLVTSFQWQMIVRYVFFCGGGGGGGGFKPVTRGLSRKRGKK